MKYLEYIKRWWYTKKQVQMGVIHPSIDSTTNWCINCYVENKHYAATYIWDGYSVCEKHLEEQLSKKIIMTEPCQCGCITGQVAKLKQNDTYNPYSHKRSECRGDDKYPYKIPAGYQGPHDEDYLDE